MPISTTQLNETRFAIHSFVAFIAVSAMQLPMSASAQDAMYDKPLADTAENAELLVRDLEEVTENFPVLAQRFGFVGITGFHVPMLCVGGVDEVCHRQTQDWCIQQAISLGLKPDYNHCLDLANKGCCRPAVSVALE